MDDGDVHDEIVRLEAHIEQLAARIENCRKFIMAARIAAVGGGLCLVAMVFGAIRLDLEVMMAAMAALLGGIVAWGANASTAQQASVEMAAAETERAALIGQLDLHAIGDRPTLH
jgi:hypothetical protein